MSTRRNLILIMLVLLIAVAGFGALYFLQPAKPTSIAQQKQWPITALTARKTDVQPTFTLFGTVESPATSQLSARVAGNVKTIHVAEGEHVAKGQRLITLQEDSLQLQLKQLQQEKKEVMAMIGIEKTLQAKNLAAVEEEADLLALARKQVERHEELMSQQAVSDAQLEAIRSEFHQQQLRLIDRQYAIANYPHRLAQLEAELGELDVAIQQIQLDIDSTQITAPFAGRITNLFASPGERVQEGQILIELFNTNQVQIRTAIPAKYLDTISQALEKNQTITAQADINGETKQLELLRLDADVTQGQIGVDALFALLEPKDTTFIGQSVNIKIYLPELTDVFVVPTQAVYDNTTAYLVKEGHLQAIPVTVLGQTENVRGETHAIISGEQLQSGELICTSYLPNAVSGLPVTVVSTGDTTHGKY